MLVYCAEPCTINILIHTSHNISSVHKTKKCKFTNKVVESSLNITMPPAAKKKRKSWGNPQRKALRQLIDALLVDPTKVAPEDIDPYYKLDPAFAEVVDEEGFRRNFRKFCGIYLQGIALKGVRRGESCHLFTIMLVH